MRGIPAMRFGLIVNLSLLAVCYAAAEPPKADKYAGRWYLDFHAVVGLPHGQKAIKGTAFSSCDLLFSARTSFEVRNDGKVLVDVSDCRFHHQGAWQTSDGTKGDYRFLGAGTLKATGQFAGDTLKLSLEWKPGVGTGMSSGKPVTQSVVTEAITSEWELGKSKPWPDAVPEWRRTAVTLSGKKTSKMPQKLADGPPLPLFERIAIVKAPTSDLEVSAKCDPESGLVGGRSALTITVKNLGPDESPEATVRIVLPPGTKVSVPKDTNKKPELFHTLKFPLEKLAKGATTSIKVEFEEASEKKGEANDTHVTVMAHVAASGHDPNQTNNGTFVTTVFKAKK